MLGERGSVTGMLLGAVAGAVGTAVMGQVSTAVYNRQGRLIRLRETQVRGGSNTNALAARKGARLFGAELDDEQAASLGQGMHYAIGMSAGALHGVARHRIPGPAPVRGLAFGAIVWLLGDEVGNVAAGITPGPAAFPWQTHARGLAAHLVYGLATEGSLCAVDWLRRRREPESPPTGHSATERAVEVVV